MTQSTLDPTTALVVVDLQAGVVAQDTEPHTTAEVVPRSVSLADAFRQHGLPVVLVRVTDQPPGRTDAEPRSAARPAGWDVLVDDLTGHADDLVVTKRGWGAFTGTDLDLLLRRHGVTQLVLTGVATTKGVESTARSAHELGYHVTLVVDAMADRAAADHQHSIERIFPALGETGSTAEVLELLAAG